MTKVVTPQKIYSVQETMDQVLAGMESCTTEEDRTGMVHLTVTPPNRNVGSVGVFIRSTNIVAVEYE